MPCTNHKLEYHFFPWQLAVSTRGFCELLMMICDCRLNISYSVLRRLIRKLTMARANLARIYHSLRQQCFLSNRDQINDSKLNLQLRIEQGNGDHSLDVPSSKDSESSKNVPSPYPAAYKSWMVEHPSALSLFDPVTNKLEGKTIVVFLDYDGTLSPIVDDPDRAFMSDEMRSAVREVAKCFPTAIISGRSRDKVKEFVKLTNVYYAGSHGMDIMVPQHKAKHCNGIHPAKSSEIEAEESFFQPAKKFLPAIKEILEILEEETSRFKGAMVEDNRFCISVHFRHVHDKDYNTLEAKVKSVLESYPGFRLTRGKKVLEIRPSIEWNKGHALEYLLDTLGFSNNSSNVLPLYIGDDRTDEDAFKVIRNRGQGYPIIVSSAPKETEASYSLRDPSEVLTFLLRIAKWKKKASSSKQRLASTS